MTKKVEGANLFDQLEQLKLGLNEILAQPESQPTEEDPHQLDPEEGDHHFVDENEHNSLLENFQIIHATRSIVEQSGHSANSEHRTNGPHGMVVINRKGEILAFNRSAAASGIFSTPRKELKLGVLLLGFIPKSHTTDFESLFKQALDGITLHLSAKLKIGGLSEQWYEFNLFPVQDAQAKVTRVVCCIEDIRERKAVEANLKALQINFQSVFKQAAVSVMLSDINLKVIQANRKFYELVEYSPAEFKNLPPLSITHPRDLAESKRLLKLLCEGQLDSFSLEKRLITKTGKVLWVFLTTNIIRDPKGKPKLIISVAQDVTDRKHAEQELIFKSNELDTFIYRASHDLRGPVASLMGLFNVVQTEFKQDKHALEYFEHYHKSVLRLNKILHNLIDLTKIKEKEIRASEVDLNDMISESLASISHSKHFENIHFKIKNDVDFKLKSDANSIRTILFHLLENAVSFMQYDNPQPFVKLEMKHESNFLIIEVTDNGQGIKKELQSEVFNMFYRANERSSGSGLGLYIVRYAVEKLNGTIQLKSKEMSGTKISVYIPYISPHSITNSSSGEDLNSPAGSNATVRAS